jgi:hypothetical protein
MPGPYQITVEVQTIVTRLNGTSTIKKALSNTFVVYPEGPTVAYRHHHLGINTTVFENDALVALAPGSNDRNKIYLRGAGHIATIDLISGELGNFVVDCGSWDNTPG